MISISGFLLIISFAFASPLSAQDVIIGGETVYVVQKGDTIDRISSKFGVTRKSLINENGLDSKKPLTPGRELRITSRRIVPKNVDGGIVVNIPDRMLYLFRNGDLSAYPVGLGMPSWRDMTQWRTPEGKFRVVRKQKDPTWHVPESMQWKMEQEGKPVKRIVPPGPDNPLGRHAVTLSLSGILIHETIWPTSVYRFRSHGCIRMLREHMETLFEGVDTDMTGEILYKPVKVAVTQEGRIFLEVNADVYGRVRDMKGEVKRLLNERGVQDKVNWQKVDQLLKDKSGIAEDITA
ncbi:MAG TPA: L,D-transpeptidase family protein [Dissulfurispiraceae bacterium]|nr:L,D-transpeptidase family protein [Dissulfurispiraceae bacterium]